MKTIKHILVTAVFVLMGTTALAQQNELSDEQKAQMEEQLEVYLQKLDLTEEQKLKFEEITEKYGKQMRGLQESNKSRLTKYKEYKSIVTNKNEEMRSILSIPQYEIYVEIQEEMRQKMIEKRRN